MRSNDDTTRNLFREFRSSAWRYEAQQTYTIPQEAPKLRAFLAGEPEPEHHPSLRNWHDTVRANTAAGKTMGRVRIVRQPLSDYLRCQLAWGIPNNIAAGEDIRILDLTNLDLDLPDQDFWFFDNSEVLLLNFRPDGTLIGRELLENPDLDKYRKLQRIALDHAASFEDYVRS
jgi:hypothetical protein